MALTGDLSVKQVHEKGKLVGACLAAALSDVENGAVILAQHERPILLLLPDGHIALSFTQAGKLLQSIR